MFWGALLFTTLISGALGNAGLNVTEIRLADGSGPYEGRVEVKVNGVWGTICDDNFRSNDAKVLCRMLNKSSTAYFGNARYGQGVGPIFAQNLACNGHETHIQQCSFQPATTCNHNEDVSLICSGCGAISVSNGVIDSISSNGSILRTTCNYGYNSSQTTALCSGAGGNWSPSSIACLPETKLNITDMRLADGIGLYDGRIEIEVNGSWGDICSDSFSNIDASKICDLLFGLPLYRYYTYHYNYGYNSRVHIDRLGCSGNEIHINECYYESASSCSTYRRAAVVCNAYPLNITDIRLANGTGPYDGRVELLYGDHWGTVCNRYMGTHDAHALCKMLNLSLTTYYTSAMFGPGQGPMLIGELRCYTYRDHINDCSSYLPPLKYSCTHSRDAELVCTACGLPNITNGKITSSNDTIMTVTCNTGYVPSTYTIECLSNGTWLQNDRCEVFGYPLNITGMRLANGVGLYDGRLEVQVNGSSWGTVCSTNFYGNEARAICNIMFGSSSYRTYTTSYYGNGAGTILIDRLDCRGTETHINQCKYNVLNTCSHSYDVAVVCNAAPLNITSIRLMNGTSPHNGRVELLVDNVWGTVCNYEVNLNVANTICNMMNLSLWTYYTTPVYGIGQGPTHIGSLSCGGSYSHIKQCSYASPYKRYCSKSKDFSLACTDDRLNITDVRLVPGPYHGRVEINVNDTWGTTCDNGFNTNDGRVICRMMNGLTVRSVYGGAYYGEGQGPVHIDRLYCSGNELNLNECSYIYDNSCGHSKDASVLCYGPDLNITRVRLADGTGPYDGRAEIEVNGTWGTICDRNFYINDADAFCNMLGLRGAQYFTGARYGEGKGPVYIDELFCDSGTSDLNYCPYLFTNACGHERDVSVVCSECGQPEIYYWDIGYFSYNGTTLYADCAYYRTYIGTLSMTCDNTTRNWITEGECQEYSYPLDVSDIRLVNGNSSSDGRVEIKSMDTWGTICDDGFGMNEAHTICRMLGMWPAVNYYLSAKYGPGTGPIFVDDLHCGIDASHINNCSYITYDNCMHHEDISVVCLDCGDPTPLNGMLNSTKTNYGAVVEVSCEAGYRLEGNDTIVCELSGEWSDSPYCQYIDCQSPTPENGAVNSSSTTNGTVVSVTCNTGYNLSGEPIIMCQSNDRWTDYPTCTILDCGVPTADNAEVNLPSNTTTYGSIAVISCKHGYLPDGSTTVSCLETGTWDEMPVCEIVDCGDPTPNKGSRNDTNTTYGTVVEITCNEGLEITGNSTIVCQADGTWSDNPVCDASDCGRPSLSNGQVDVSNGTTTGSVATLTCNMGYDLTGPSLIVCHSSGWNDTSECQLQDCGDPTPENGKVVSSSGTTYGETATIDCDEGHAMEGDSTISCEDGGRWSSNTTCTIKDCGPLKRPDNGYIVESSGTVFNSTITFSCDAGFLLVGESTLHCQSDGTWSSDVPSCARLGDIGDPCDDVTYCKTESAVCRKSKCTCKTGVHDTRIDTCDTMPLYPYGINESDTVIDDWKQCAERIKFTPGLPFFGKVYTRIFVCPHGVVSFGRRYNNPTPPKNKNKVKDIKRDMVAPFHAHFKTGNVYFRSYDVLDSYETLQGRAEKGHIEDRVRQFAGVTSFEASFILIVTWENVLPEDRDFDTSESEASTIQLVLVSNGEMTYCFYIYPNGLLKWISNRRQYAPVWVGYFSKKDTPFTHHNSFIPDALKLDINVKHGGVSGVLFKSLVRVQESVKNNNISCIKWYQDNKHEKQHIDLMNSWLPQCPCDISLARWDPWFWHIDRWNWYNRKNFTCVDMLPGRIYRPYGKSCCYDYRTSLWVDERPIAGGFFRYHPENAKDHYNHDIIPKEMCCNPLTPFCKFYYDLRPTGTCYNRSPYNFGSFWGDPHFRTLDGLNFTFNGLGEYILLQIQTENNTFTLQARTERATKEDGNLSDATVFSAFAAKDETNASVHVELNRAKKGFNIYGNGLDLTQKYNQKTEDDDPTLPVPGGTLFVSKRSETLVVLFPSSGISLNISVTVEMLSLSVIVPMKFHNITSGLLGNYNGKPEDDFTLPNGTLLPSNLTEREVFDYGQNWAISEENSAFMYPDGKNHSDYHNTTYVPRFLDEVDPDKRLEAEKACNGSENIECVFDYVFTESREIAEATNTMKGDAEKTKNEMDEVVPSLIGCENINSTVKQMVYCPITIEDGSSVNFLANNVNATFNKTLGAISYYQGNVEPVDIRVVAKNSKGRSSPAFIVVVLLCTGCSERGKCINIPRDDPRNTEYFKYATCECEKGYEGPDCENVFDGCADHPCSLGRNCTSLSATEQKELNRTYVCDACPEGFMSNDDYNDTCSDNDECENNPCDQTCFNTEGSYECMCSGGYRVDTRDRNKCVDINECEDLNTPHNCSQNCTNIEGSFNCSCYNGYKLVSENCTQDNTTEHSCSEKNCSQTAGCMINADNKPVCFCDNGFELDGDNSCRDIDECKRNACPQYCDNFDGGFSCSCFTGYKLVGYTTCQECDVGTWGENCQNECQCTGEGVKSCDPVKGCICEDGWQGDTCDEDINECNATIDVCDDPRKMCENSPGSFICKCREGFMETVDGDCEDIDECIVPSLHTCDQICENNLGSYSCECETGYISRESVCENIDECALKIHDCEQVCDDTPGSYNCFCYFGYTLSDDRANCTKLSDPCLTIYGLNCSHYCFISTDHAECRCQHGYLLGSDNQTCTDIDECTNGQHTCDTNAECKNTRGSYTCECSIGSKLENDGRTCSECDAFHYGKNCAFNCSCLNGVCNKTQGCVCDNGWRGNNCAIDLDECDTGQLVCPMQNEVCINTLGSAICRCINGYVKNETRPCIDIDECSDGQLNTCEQRCENTPGSYICGCEQGFLYTDGTCKDIDECENKKSDCEQLCENTLGSYRCYCEDGFKLNQTDRVSCTPAYGCSDSTTCGNNSICFSSDGGDSCRCVNGFKNVSGQCEDIDECKTSPKPCSQNCTNNEGGYSCTCDVGFYLTKDLTTCKECEAGTYGDNCTQNCTCNVQNSESCDRINGSCTCKIGWNGTRCDLDIDECEDTTLCTNHSTCKNIDGGYNCVCDVGYFKTSSGSCSVCDNMHYGENCAKECSCARSNTLSCNHTNGHCECREGWKGERCSEDVDECDGDLDKCMEHATCNNTLGSYKCICNIGFSEIEDKCRDINECITGQHDCNPHECVNTPGNYTCKCKKGYQGVWTDCKVCSNNTYGENCSETCGCHPTHTEKEDDQRLCDRLTGSCKCMSNWEGDTCEVDVDECEDDNICNHIPNSGCVNSDGWYKCDCFRGFVEDGMHCVPDDESTTTPLPDAAINLKFNLHIKDIKIPDTDNLNVFATYTKYLNQAMESLKRHYKQFTKADLDIRIIDIRKGSLIIDYVVQYKNNDVDVAVALIEAAKKDTEVTFNGEEYKASIESESFDVTDGMCDILQSIGSCSLEYCVEENGVAKCKVNELNTPQIIGIAVGCGLFVFIIAMVIIVCVRRKRDTEKKTLTQAAHGRSLPDVPKHKQLGVDKVRTWQDSNDPRYLTWKTMLTASPLDRKDEHVDRQNAMKKLYDEPYKIPRAHVRQPKTLAEKDSMYF